ncbi:MAG: hypothetical protein JETCAE01_22180 [Anaerolineaceae bacterium]|nr:MAG: hypothetical protein EDM79_18860 [Chloroflexota bacterium]MCE7858589.1 hypothetical protein [Chloroflexi bacterium CFX2]GJQ36208.1 MAG: hypothetical protein JETCAE01_22180 [Anaerolineaceae bacterium]
MKVVSILLALINFLAGVLLILSCISSNETFAWVAWKTALGFMGVAFGILTFKDSAQPVAQCRMILYGLLLVIAGVSIVAYGIHWSIVSGDPKNTVMVVGTSFFLHGFTSVLGIVID